MCQRWSAQPTIFASCGILGEVSSCALAVRPIEIDATAAFSFLFIGEVGRAEALKAIANSEMVVNHVQNDTDAEKMCSVDKGARIIRAAVKMCRRVKKDAIVSPAKVAAKLIDGHHLDKRDAQTCQ